MLALRLARGAHPLVLLRRLTVAAAAAGTGFLLLCTLGYALGHPDQASAAVLRLAWCLAPLAATVYLAVAVARTDPAAQPRAAVDAVVLGPAGMALLATVSTALSGALGSLVALLFFLQLRDGVSWLPFDGAAAGLLAAGWPLPLGAVLTLLLVVPVTAAAACAIALRPSRATTATEDDPVEPTPAPSGLRWGVALMVAGLALVMYAARGAGGGVPMPGRLLQTPAGVLGGWAMTALGLVLAGPALTYQCGRLLQSAQPGATRLLAGRALQEEARRIGRPLGVLCAATAGALALGTLAAGRRPELDPLTVLGLVLMVACTAMTLCTAAIEVRQGRAPTTYTLLRLGAPVAVLRSAAGLRIAVLFAVLAPLTWAIGTLAALPLSS